MSTDTDKLKQKQKVRKYLVFTGMFLLFLGCMWLIFAPSEKDRQEEERKAGFNAELPDPRGTGIEADKMAAYEQADMRRRQEEKMRTLADFSALADERRQENVPEPDVAVDVAREGGSRQHRSGGSGRSEAFASSASAYNGINATLGSFYETPEEDPEKEALKAEVEQLRQAAAAQTAGPSYEEQVALLEKSYELAAKYMPSGGNTGTADSQEAESPSRERNAKAVPVGLVSSPVVSSLPQPLADSVQFARLLSGTDAGFHTAVGDAGTQVARNTIRACVHGDQTVVSGQNVRLRLLEAMRAGRLVLPRNTLLWNWPCWTVTDRTGYSFPARRKRTRSGRWPPTWGRTSARPSPSPTSRRATRFSPNLDGEPYRACRSIFPRRCARRKCISNQDMS